MAKSKLTGDEIKVEEPKPAEPAVAPPAVTDESKAEMKPTEPAKAPDVVVEPVKSLNKYEVHMKEMGVHVVPTVVDAANEYEAVEKFFKMTGVIETPHKPTVRKL